MQKKKIVVILIIILITIVIGVSFDVLTDPFISCRYSIEDIFSDCASCMGTCYAKIAHEKKELDICNNIENEELKNSCIIGTATGKGDPTICQNVIVIPGYTKTNNINGFIDQCLINVASSVNNASICDLLKTESWKNACYSASKQK